MRNRPLLVFLGVLLAFFLLTSACAAGLTAGGLLQKRLVTPLSETSLPASTETSRPASAELIPADSGSKEKATPTSKAPASSGDEQPQATPEEKKAQPAISREDLFKPFWQAWDLVHQQYVDQPIDDIALMRGATRGMMRRTAGLSRSWANSVGSE